MRDAKVKLLIVEDEPTVRHSLSLIFASLGHYVRSAEDGFSALEQIREMPPDILLSDLNMPGMSGFELLSIVRRRFPAIYVIATSGAYSGDGIPRGIAADAFYKKGTGPASLIRIVEAAIDSEPAPLPAHRKWTPIWIPPAGTRPSEEKRLLIGCPECLRPFPQVPGGVDRLFHETACVFCRTPIHYAIAQSMGPIPELAMA